MEWWSGGVVGLEFSNFEFRFSNDPKGDNELVNHGFHGWDRIKKGIAQRAQKWSGGVMGRRGIMGWMGHES